MSKDLQSNIKINVNSNAKEASRDLDELKKKIEDIKGANNGSKPINLSKDYNLGISSSDSDTQTESIMEQINAIDDLSDSYGSLGEAAGESGEQIISSGAVMGASITAVTAVLKILYEQFEDTCDLIKDISLGVAGGLVDGFEMAVEAAQNLLDIVDKAIEELRELADMGAEIQEGYYSIFNYLGDEAGTQLVDFSNNLQTLYGLDADSLIGEMRGILGMVSNMNMNMEDSLRMAKAFTSFSNDLAAFSGYDFEEVVGQLEGAVNLGVLKVTSPLVKALDMTAEDVEIFRELNSVEERAQFLLSKGEKVRDKYQNWLMTAGGKVGLFNTSLQILNGSVAKLSTGIMAIFAPALREIVNLLDLCVNKLMQVLKIDLTSADANLAEAMDWTTESINSTVDAAENAKRKLAGFDDVIQINDTSSGGSTAGFGMSQEELNKLLDAYNELDGFNIPASRFAEGIASIGDAISNGDWSGAGAELNSLLRDLLTLDWDKIKGGAVDIGKDLSDFINGLFSNSDLGGTVGSTLADGLNTGIYFLSSFAANMNWSSVGNNLASSWINFWKTFDSTELGKGIYNWLSGGLEAASSYVSDMWNTGTWIDIDKDGIEDTLVNGWELSGFKLGDIINSFFDDFDETDVQNLVDSITGFIGGVFDGIDAFLQTVDTEDIKETLKKIITRLVESLSKNAEKWGSTLNDLIVTLLDLLEYAIDTADQAGLTTAISEFLNALDIDQILLQWLGIKSKLWLAELDVTITQIIQSWATFMSNAWENLAEFFSAIVLFVVGIFVSIGAAIWDGLTWIGAKVSEWWTGVTEWWAGVDTWLAGKIEDIANWGMNILGGIQAAFDPQTWINLGKAAFEGLWEGIEGVWDSIKSWWNNNIAGDLIDIDLPDWLAEWSGSESFTIGIPKLAKGGIATRSTLANIGEAGAEAVLPLENNTGWMDDFASKLASRINGGSGVGGQAIYLDMSGYVKNIYTRAEMLEFAELVVDALKLYGVNVAMTY